MLPAYLAARELEQRRREETSETARQLPLYVVEMSVLLPEGEDTVDIPDWATNY